jgi:hypothetical protein
METLYESFCGRSGHGRGWDTLRDLFFPGARIYRADVSKAGCAQAGAGSIEEIIETMSASCEDNCFSAREISRHTEKTGNLAKVFSIYEVRYRPEDTKPFRRGKNRIQLYHDGRRWRITSMVLCDYRCDRPLSAEQSAGVEKSGGNWRPQRRPSPFQSSPHCG